MTNPDSRTHTNLLQCLTERETLHLDRLLLCLEIASAAHQQVISTMDGAVKQIFDQAAAGTINGFIITPGGLVGPPWLFLEQVVPYLVKKRLFHERYSATTFAGCLVEE